MLIEFNESPAMIVREMNGNKLNLHAELKFRSNLKFLSKYFDNYQITHKYL